MKAVKWIAVLMVLAMIFALPMLAEGEAATEAVEETSETSEPADSQTIFAIMLLSTVVAAMLISMLAHRGRDHTKYL